MGVSKFGDRRDSRVPNGSDGIERGGPEDALPGDPDDEDEFDCELDDDLDCELDDDLDDREEDDAPPYWDSYKDYPYAMETENDTVLSLQPCVQERALLNTLDIFGVTLDRLAAYLRSRSDPWEDDDEVEDEDDLEFLVGELFGRDDEDPLGDDFEDLKGLDCFDIETLCGLYGFDEDSGAFTPRGYSCADVGSGDEMNILLETLGFTLHSDLYGGAYGDGRIGVYFIPPEE